MKSSSKTLRRHHAAAPGRGPGKVQPEADFTAEGSPPPGQVGAEPPALPKAERVETATAHEGGKR